MGRIAPGQKNEPLKNVAWHTFAFASYILVAIFLRLKLLIILGAAVWVGGAIAAQMKPNERDSIIRRLQQTSLIYAWGAVSFRVLMFVISDTPLTQWQRQLSIPVPPAFMASIQGWYAMANMIFLIGFPVAYFVYLSQQIFITRSNKEVTQRRSEMMRKITPGEIDVR